MIQEKPTWTAGVLHKALVDMLPTFVKDPFSDQPQLDVPKLHPALGLSYETVYKWLRKDKLTTKNAQKLLDLACSSANSDALVRLGRTAPTVSDFNRFVYP